MDVSDGWFWCGADVKEKVSRGAQAATRVKAALCCVMQADSRPAGKPRHGSGSFPSGAVQTTAASLNI